MTKYRPQRPTRHFCTGAGSFFLWQTAQTAKKRAAAHFNGLKTYKTAKKFFLFLVRLLGGLRLLCGQNLLL